MLVTIRRSGRLLQRGIIAFSLIVIAAISLLVVELIAAQHESALERAKFDAANLSGAFEAQVRQTIDAVSSAVDRFKLDLQQGEDPKAAIRRSDLLNLPAQITVIGAEGNVIASTIEGRETADFCSREHMLFHSKSRHRGLLIGKPVRSRASERIYETLSSAFERANGQFAGIIIASIEPELLTDLSRSVDLGKTGNLMVIGTDGIVRAYLSEAGGQESSADLIGSAPEGIPALHEAEFDDQGSYELASPIDGVPRIYHWRKVRGYPLVVIVGLGRQEALLVAKNQNALVLGVGGAALLLAFLMPIALYREINKRIANELDLNIEKSKLKMANDALATERANLKSINEELDAEKRRAESASCAKSAFLTNMSHEFRTPMHAILNYTNMGLKKLEADDEIKLKRYFENIRSSGTRLLRMINGLLDLAKLEAGKIDITLAKVDLLDIVKAAQSELGSLFEEKRIGLTIEAAAKDSMVYADPNRIAQVVINLLSNAIKFSPPGEKIEIVIQDTTTAEGQAATLCSVKDRGPGVPPDELDAIFDRFNQSSITVNNGSGAGLGLTICRELIDLHGGDIWASNRRTGGASFSFLIPKDPRPTEFKESDRFLVAL
jgi:signal transduction histidine kinase